MEQSLKQYSAKATDTAKIRNISYFIVNEQLIEAERAKS